MLRETSFRKKTIGCCSYNNRTVNIWFDTSFWQTSNWAWTERAVTEIIGEDVTYDVLRVQLANQSFWYIIYITLLVFPSEIDKYVRCIRVFLYIFNICN